MSSDNESWFHFRLLPKNREDWLGAFLFLFQSFVVVAFVVRRIFWFFFARTMSGFSTKVTSYDYYYFTESLDLGYGVCLVVLSYNGIADLITGRWRRGCLNLCLAALNAWVFFFMRPYAWS